MSSTESATALLGQLGPGQHAVVRRVGGERHVVRRLLEMGLLPGTRVSVLRVAPLGDPIELSLRGYALSIRRVDAMRIEIDRVAP
jgi:Fe2+ transport system protein FeoA